MADELKADNTDQTDKRLKERKDRIKNDINTAEAYFAEEYARKTELTTARYYGMRDRNPNMPEWCSNMTANLGFGLVHSEAGQLMPGIFQPNQFFTLTANDEASEMGVKALQECMMRQLPQMGFFKQHFWAIMDKLYTPAGWVYWGWERFEKNKRKRSVVKGEIQTENNPKKISQPFCRSVDVRDVLYDHKGYGQGDMQFWALKERVTIEEIRNNKEVYNKESEVKAFLELVDNLKPEQKKNLNGRVLIHTHWTKEDVGVMTETGHMLTDRPNPYDRIPARCMVKYTEPRKVMGISLIEAGYDMIDAQDDLLNAVFDGVIQDVHKTTVYTGSLTDEDLEKYPGKVIRLKEGQKLENLQSQPMGNDWINVGVKVSETLNKVLGNVDQIEDRGVTTATESRQIQARSNVGRRTDIDLNREDYLKWALEFWAEMIIDNMTEDEVIAVIGEKKAKSLNLIKEQLKLKELNYTITITGDNDMEDRMVYVQNVGSFVGTLGQIAQLKGSGVDLPVNFDILIRDLTAKFNFSEGVFIDRANAKNQGITPEQEIATVAQSQGITPEAYLQSIGQGADPQTVMQGIQQAGGLEAYLKNMAVQAGEAQA